MSYVSEIIRKRVREKAGNRCEYCLSHQDYIMGRLQIDHVYPVARGGENTEENLSLACELCNQYKWTKTEELDPITNQNVTLFNPRQQIWSEHFTWSDDGTEIIWFTIQRF